MKSKRIPIVNMIIAALLVSANLYTGCIWGDDDDEKANPGLVELILVDSSGNTISSPSIGAILIELNGVSIDENETNISNSELLVSEIASVPNYSNKYRMLVIKDGDDCSDDMIGNVYLHNKNKISNLSFVIHDVYSGENQNLDVADYTVSLVTE
ncbi:MAG: hypothetical protein KOO63_12615 [Bacteroidales bacterium]|nr:hypothetical protein [Candidatus Latescibacterota bacterium]